MSFVAVAALYSCTETIDTSSRYVFKEETISSYLSKQEIYSEYYDLLGRVPISDMSETTVRQLMAARGNFTCFAPTNDAIHEYLKTLVQDSLIAEPSWSSFTDSTKLDSIRKVIVFNSIIDGGDEVTQLFETANFPVENNSELSIGNLLDSKLTVNYVDNHPDSIYINNDCPIDIINRDIPAINGFVHRIHKVIAPRNVTAAYYLQNILDKQIEGYLVAARVIQACGLMDTLTKVRDEVYEKLYQSGQIPDLIGMTSYGFAEGSIGYAPK
ncbi:MAG: fasciclin domain-containing protein, partial [Bacteroidaceae bacterium]|nr:fasciclin domain-containing protein [Bacteroidaceae bacterium]